MPLPKINQPLFELTIPSTEQKVKYRPFTVKEEKILLIARESKDIDQVVLSIKQIVSNCVQDQIDVDKLAIFDIEYIMLNLRAKSVSNVMEFAIRDPDTKEKVELEIDINDIEVKKSEDHNSLIQVDSDVYVKMSYPSILQLKEMTATKEDGSSTQEALLNIMLGCIESVVSGDDVYLLSEFNDKEVVEFIESLSSQNLKDIERFFETMPVLRYEKKYKLEDGTEKTFVAEGTETFFI